MLTRKEAVNQMLENRARIKDVKAIEFIEIITDKIQIAVNRGLGYTEIDIDNIDSDIIDTVILFVKNKGYRVSRKYKNIQTPYGVYNGAYLKIQWDLPWWRRLFNV